MLRAIDDDLFQEGQHLEEEAPATHQEIRTLMESQAMLKQYCYERHEVQALNWYTTAKTTIDALMSRRQVGEHSVNANFQRFQVVSSRLKSNVHKNLDAVVLTSESIGKLRAVHLWSAGLQVGPSRHIRIGYVGSVAKLGHVTSVPGARSVSSSPRQTYRAPVAPSRVVVLSPRASPRGPSQAKLVRIQSPPASSPRSAAPIRIRSSSASSPRSTTPVRTYEHTSPGFAARPFASKSRLHTVTDKDPVTVTFARPATSYPSIYAQGRPMSPASYHRMHRLD